MNFSLEMSQLVGALLVGTRIVAWLMVAPPFSYRAFPNNVKILLAMGLALVIRPAVPPELATDGIKTGALIVAILGEATIGVGLGFLCVLVYFVVQAAGNVIDTLGGFSMAFGFDPQLNAGGSTMGKIYHLTMYALLFSSNAHLLILRGLLTTFEVIPIGGWLRMGPFMAVTTEAMSRFLVAALQIAGPLVAVLFLTDVGLGLMARIAPQLNILSLAFPLKIAITLSLVATSVLALPDVIATLTDVALSVTARAVRG